MGVTYKLKQEVVDFILELKRNDPALSCRKISDLSTEHFKKPISKSSVNAVLKTSSLSSPIGRRSLPEKKEEKFQIPQHRKEQIFTSIRPEVLEEKKAVIPEPALLPEVKAVSPQLIENMGVLFLKAAQWQIKRQGVLKFILEKFGPLPLDEKTLKLAEAFLFLPLFDEASAGRFVACEKKTLWQLNGIAFEPTTNQKKDCLEALNSLEGKGRLIALEYAQMFSEASFFRFSLRDGSDFCIDAQMNSCWPTARVNGDFSVPLDKSLDTLSRFFMASASPILLRSCSTENDFSKSFLNMLAAFDDCPGKQIVSVDLMTSRQEVISSFESIVRKKRHYILGLQGASGLLKSVSADSSQEPHEARCALTGETCYYRAAQTAFRLPDGQQISADVYFLSRQKNDAPFLALVSNIPAGVRPEKSIVEDFLARWPNPRKGSEYFNGRKTVVCQSSSDIIAPPDEDFKPEGGPTLFQDEGFAGCLADRLLAALHGYAARHFFRPEDKAMDFAEAQKRFYSLPGTFTKDQGALKAVFVVSESGGYVEEAAFLVARLNEAGVFDPTGHRVAAEIAFSS